MERKKAKEFQSECSSQTLYTTGERPPKDGNPNTWISQSKSDPEPLGLRLASIDTLGPLEKLVGPTVIANLQRALKDYCYHLKDEGIVGRCANPGPDPPFPMRKYYFKVAYPQ